MSIYNTTKEERKLVLEICKQMEAEGVEIDFVREIEVIANKYQGVFDLLELWAESSVDEKNRVMTDLIEEVADYKSMPVFPTFIPK